MSRESITKFHASAIPQRMRELHTTGHLLVVFASESKKETPEEVQARADQMQSKLEAPILVVIITGGSNGLYRKPRVSAWTLAEKIAGGLHGCHHKS